MTQPEAPQDALITVVLRYSLAQHTLRFLLMDFWLTAILVRWALKALETGRVPLQRKGRKLVKLRKKSK